MKIYELKNNRLLQTELGVPSLQEQDVLFDRSADTINVEIIDYVTFHLDGNGIVTIRRNTSGGFERRKYVLLDKRYGEEDLLILKSEELLVPEDLGELERKMMEAQKAVTEEMKRTK